MKTGSTLALSAILSFCQLQSKAINYEWAHSMGGAGTDRAYATAYDASGNVYVTGNFSGVVDFDPGPGVQNLSASGTNDIFLAKYDATGKYLWAHSFGSTGENAGTAVMVMSNGDVVFGGSFSGTVDFDPDMGIVNKTSSGYGDAFFARYDKFGNFIWVKQIADAYNGAVKKLRTDAAGSILVAGEFSSIADFNPGGTPVMLDGAAGGLFFAKYDGMTGMNMWARNIGPSGGSQSIRDMELDDAGNIYLAGSFTGTADFDPGAGVNHLIATGYQDLFLARYSVAGDLVWAGNAGSASNVAFANGISIDDAGHIDVTGIFYESVDFDFGTGSALMTATHPMTQNFFIAQYDTAGKYQWVHTFGPATSSGGLSDGMDLVTDKSGNMYVSGTFSYGTDFDPGAGNVSLTAATGDIYLASYSANGDYRWVRNLKCRNVIGASSNKANAVLTIDKASDILYMAGAISDTADFDLSPSGVAQQIPAGDLDMFVAQYNSISTGIRDMTTGSSAVTLYPNPSNGTAALAYELDNTTDVTISLNSVTGQQLASWTYNGQPAGKHLLPLDEALSGLQAGLYFVTIRADEQRVTQRLCLTGK